LKNYLVGERMSRFEKISLILGGFILGVLLGCFIGFAQHPIPIDPEVIRQTTINEIIKLIQSR
jgi:hypothetical protein